MNIFEAQDALADLLSNIAVGVKRHYWRLRGDDANSLNHLLGIDEKEMMDILQLCGILVKKGTEFSKNNFDFFLVRSGLSCVESSHGKMFKKEKFLLIGNGGDDPLLPRESCVNGELKYVPVEDIHWRKLVTKSQKGKLPQLLDACKVNPDPQSPKKSKKKVDANEKDITPRGMMLDFLCDLASTSVAKGQSQTSDRSLSRFNKLITVAIESEAKLSLEAAVEKMRDALEAEEKLRTQEVITPERACSAAVVQPVAATQPSQLAKVVTPTQLCPNAEQQPQVVEVSAVDEVIAQLQEEALLQSLLKKHLSLSNRRHIQLQHNNGRRFLVLSPPETVSTGAFSAEAKRTGWIDTMLNAEDKQEGMMQHLAKKDPIMHSKIGQKRKLSMQTVGLSTVQTLALARVANLNDSRLQKLRSFVKKMGGVNLQHTRTIAREVDTRVGASRTREAKFGNIVHEWCGAKGKEKKPPESMDHWTSSLFAEIATEVDCHLTHVFSVTKELKSMPIIDCVAPGFENAGVVVCVGGDHGAKHCPILAKVNLSSPQERKARGELNYQCPVIQFASIQCSKDTCEALESTVMPAVREDAKQLSKRCIMTVHCGDNPRSSFKSCDVPRSIDMDSIACRNHQDVVVLSFSHTKDDILCFGSIRLDPNPSSLGTSKLQTLRVISCFNDLYVGDLAFQAMLIGMNNSSGKHCLLCGLGASKFNCTHDKMMPRAKECLREHLEKCILCQRKTKAKDPKPNYKGVNKSGLLDIDPQRLVVPMLHCPMGLIDEALESFLHCVNTQVERLDQATIDAKKNYDLKKELVRLAETSYQQTVAVRQNNDNPDASRLEEETKKALDEAKKVEAKAKESYEEALKRHNAKKTSLSQQFEETYRIHKVTREYCHGGKFNGVNCVRTMSNAEALFTGDGNEKGGFLELCFRKMKEGVREEDARRKLKDYARLVGLLDAIWANVGGIEGLLPTEKKTEQTAKAIQEGKEQWPRMGLSTTQPKWHLTFDGHLFDQYKKCGGLADKADDTIEAFHQVSMQLRMRFRGTRSHKMQENCIRRELKRGRDPKIKSVVSSHLKSIKQSAGAKRKQEADARQAEAKRVKEERREAFVNNNRQ